VILKILKIFPQIFFNKIITLGKKNPILLGQNYNKKISGEKKSGPNHG
jgi:hypothetical protein